MGVLTYLGLGSNLGDAAANVQGAIEGLRETQGLRDVRASSLWRTAPWGNTAQPAFVNAVVELRAFVEPSLILESAQRIEAAMGRERSAEGPRYAPRTMDIDLLFYGAAVLREPHLSVPHPHLHERRFVLEPLCELNPALVHPVFQVTVDELRARCADTGAVEKLS
jgi:2-amino-4-hydroxy-6-hydroxymethyldihydropteridine diphosphokinase